MIRETFAKTVTRVCAAVIIIGIIFIGAMMLLTKPSGTEYTINGIFLEDMKVSGTGLFMTDNGMYEASNKIAIDKGIDALKHRGEYVIVLNDNNTPDDVTDDHVITWNRIN